MKAWIRPSEPFRVSVTQSAVQRLLPVAATPSDHGLIQEAVIGASPHKLKSAPLAQHSDMTNTRTVHSKEARRLIAPIREQIFGIDARREQGAKLRNFRLNGRGLSLYSSQNG